MTSNLLVFKDPEYTKTLTIIDGKDIFETEFWSESEDITIYKRKNSSESFWVIEDIYRGFSKSQSYGFSPFTC